MKNNPFPSSEQSNRKIKDFTVEFKIKIKGNSDSKQGNPISLFSFNLYFLCENLCELFIFRKNVCEKCKIII